MTEHAHHSNDVIDIIEEFEVDGAQRRIAHLSSEKNQKQEELLIIEYQENYYGVPLYCAHEGMSLAQAPISETGELVCQRHGQCFKLDSSTPNTYLLYRIKNQFFRLSEEQKKKISTSKSRWHTSGQTIKNEVNALKAANSALEKNLFTNIEKMDLMLRQVESRKEELEIQAERLESLYELIDSITDSITELLIVTNNQGVITRVNRYAEQALGCDKIQILGKSPDELISKQDLKELTEQLGQKSHWDHRPILYRMIYHSNLFEKEIQLRPHAEISQDHKNHYIMRGTLLYSSAGKEEGMILTASDITQVKAKEDKIRQREIQQNLALLQATLSSLGQGVAVFDEQGYLRIWNDQYPVTLRYSDQLTLEQSNFNKLSSIDRILIRGKYTPKLDKLFKEQLQWSYKYKADNRVVELESFPMPNGGFTITAKDVTHRRKREEQVRMLSHAVEQSPTEIVITDTQGQIVYANPMFTTNTGYSQNEAMGSRTNLVRSGEMNNTFYRDLWQTIKEGHSWRGEIINQKKSGEKFWQLMAISPVRDDDGEITHYLAVKEDISRQKKAEQRLKFQADHDTLTQLPNRIHFHREVKIAIKKAKDRNIRSALLFLDLNNFKDVNDTLGHQAGDRLLQAVSKRLLGSIRKEDTIARLGGDEFAIIQNDIQDSDSLSDLPSRIIDALLEPFGIDNNLLHIGVSIGIAMIPDDGDNAEALLSNSDVAMYAAKSHHGSTFCFYDQKMYANLQRRRDIETSLRTAIENNEFNLFFQAKININSGNLVGAEALIRWNNPELGLVSPIEFIPIAESTGIINPIGEWVLTEALAQYCRWRSLGLPITSIGVNISPVQLRTLQLPEIIFNALQQCQLPASVLELEITETAAITDPETVQQQLKKLKNMGVSLALDDFGTGYSSLSHIVQLPIDRVKIDRTFVSNMDTSTQAKAVVESIIQMSQVMKKQVIAEGVETEAQLNSLHQLGCDEAQGYFISKPIPSDEFISWAVKSGLPSSENHD